MSEIDDSASGWPFLVARGRHTDYRTLLAPDFMVERRMHGQLRDKARLDSPAGVQQTILDNAEVGALTLLYWSERLVSGDLDGHATNADAPVTDEHGRPLQMLYGLVTRRPPSGPPDERDFAAARAAALTCYRRYLADEDGHDVEASRTFTLHTPLVDPVEPTRAPAVRVVGMVEGESAGGGDGRPDGSLSSLLARYGRVLAAGAVVAVVVVAVASWLLRPRSNIEVRDTRITPAQGDVDCNAPLRFELNATIRARGDGRVTYRWAPANLIDGVSRNGTLNLETDEQQQITTTATRRLSGNKPEGTFRLYVDGQERTLNYALRCAAGGR